MSSPPKRGRRAEAAEAFRCSEAAACLASAAAACLALEAAASAVRESQEMRYLPVEVAAKTMSGLGKSALVRGCNEGENGLRLRAYAHVQLD